MHEDARKMHRTKVRVKNFGKMRKAPSGWPRPCQKNGQAGRGLGMVQKVFGKEWD